MVPPSILSSSGGLVACMVLLHFWQVARTAVMDVKCSGVPSVVPRTSCRWKEPVLGAGILGVSCLGLALLLSDGEQGSTKSDVGVCPAERLVR